MEKFKLTEIQSVAILDMQLRRLAALERQKIDDELKMVRETITYLEDLLAHPEKILKVIKDELIELGVKPEDIVCEKSSGSTFEQLLELGDIAGKESLEALTIITNEYHLPRVKALVQYNQILTKAFSHCRLVFKSA